MALVAATFRSPMMAEGVTERKRPGLFVKPRIQWIDFSFNQHNLYNPRLNKLRS